MSASLLFIPDISGFTDFVNDTEISHSRHIISELLEQLINANEIGLILAEIEGDALFFYKQGIPPSSRDLLRQIEKMYLIFHEHIQLYEHQRICHCGACQSAQNLQLKFILHFGDINFIEIKSFKKPHGKDVIVIHRLLKNQIPLKEYLLITHSLKVEAAQLDESDFNFIQAEEDYDVGKVAYQYTNISPLLKKINRRQDPIIGFETKNPLTINNTVIQRPPGEVFEIISNFEYRNLWNTQPTFLYEKERVNRIGTSHICIIDNQEIHFETISKGDRKDKLVYGEKTAAFPLMEKVSTYFTVEPYQNIHSKITFEAHFQPKYWLAKAIIPLLKWKLKKTFKGILLRIKEVAENREDQPVSEVV